MKIDFTGWRYIELLEADSAEVSRYVWPPSGYSVYTHYRETGDLHACRLWYNNIPAGKTVRCLFGPMAALPCGDYELVNPAVTLNGRTVRFPVTLETGTYFELRGGKCVKYSRENVPVEEFLPEGAVPTLEKGENRISVGAESPQGTSRRMELTVIGEGDRLQ